MPTIQRLLTDDTGQALVTAINNVVAAVKPNATEIQMSSSDTTTVATAITNINDKIGTVPSGQTVEGQITTLNRNIAITANGNTHAEIASGRAVIVRNHSTLADGLYWASTSIATNATLSTSNLTADANGGLNKLKSDIDHLDGYVNVRARRGGAAVGTVFSVMCDYNVALILINHDIQIQVWLSGSTGLAVTVRSVDSNNAESVFTKTGENSLTFSSTSATGEGITITRYDSAIVLTSTISKSILCFS